MLAVGSMSVRINPPLVWMNCCSCDIVPVWLVLVFALTHLLFRSLLLSSWFKGRWSGIGWGYSYVSKPYKKRLKAKEHLQKCFAKGVGKGVIRWFVRGWVFPGEKSISMSNSGSKVKVASMATTRSLRGQLQDQKQG